MNPAAALVFDLDDTLYPEKDFVRSGFHAVDDWLHSRNVCEGFFQVAWRIFEAGTREDVFNLTLRRLAVEASDLIPLMVAAYRAHEPNIQVFADVDSALSRLRSEYRLGILTDGHLETQRNKIRALGLTERVEAILYSDELGRDCWKPSPAPFSAIMKRLDVRGDQCVYIADNPSKDFSGARQLGWQTVHIRRPDGMYADLPADADSSIATIGDLEDLERLLR